MKKTQLSCIIALLILAPANPAFCRDKVTRTAKRTTAKATSEVKGWFHRKHKPKAAETKSKALRIPNGSPVAARSTNGEKVKGNLTKVTDEGVSIRSGKEPVQTLQFSQIEELKQTRGRLAYPDGSFDTRKVDALLGDIPENAPLTLKLADKEKVSGHYIGKSAGSVKVQTPEGGKMIDRTIPKDQITSIKAEKPGLFRKPKYQSPDLVRKTVSGAPVGSPLDIKTPDGRDVSGKLTASDENGFSVQALEDGKIVTKEILYDQVASVKRPSAGMRDRIPGMQPPALQSSSQLKSAAMGIPAGSPVTLALPDGTKKIGKLVGVTNEGMQVQSLRAGNVNTQTIGYDQIGSVKQGVPATPTDRAKKVGKAGAMVVVTGIISGALANAF